MDFWQVINKRKCVRSFDPAKEVTDEQIEKIIQAGRRAPSAGGIYPVDFIVIKDLNTKEKLTEAAFGQSFIADAPVVIIVVVDAKKTASRYASRGEKLYSIQDGAAATENIFLAATALGLGACWVGAFDEEGVKEILRLNKDQRPQAIMPIGREK